MMLPLLDTLKLGKPLEKKNVSKGMIHCNVRYGAVFENKSQFLGKNSFLEEPKLS